MAESRNIPYGSFYGSPLANPAKLEELEKFSPGSPDQNLIFTDDKESSSSVFLRVAKMYRLEKS